MSVAQRAVYEPTRSTEAQGIRLSGWGSGTIAEDVTLAFEGSNSIRISSRNFFQGGLIQLSSPVNMSTEAQTRDSLLLLSVNVPGSTVGGGQPGTLPSGLGRPGVGGGRPGGFPGGGAPGFAGVAPGSPSSSSFQNVDSPLRTLRLVVSTTDGLKSEAFLDTSTTVRDERGWFSVGIPLQAINGFARTNKVIESIALAADSISTFHVGQIRVLQDRTPVFAEPNVREVNLAFGDAFTFTANGFAGATPVRFLWDFNAADGIQVDAEGAVVTRRFRREGTFTVTLTAVDIYGLKAPFSTTLQVIVNP